MRSFDLEFSKELAERSLIGLTWPAEIGGGGRSNVERLAMTEELLRAGAPVAAHWMGDRQIGPAIIRNGNLALVREMIPGILNAEVVFCLGMSEPGAGSDLAAIRTRADRDDTDWLITGHKIWTSHAHRATHAYVLARSHQTERKHDGLSEFIVDMDSAGVSVEPIRDLHGEHHFNEVRFDHARVPSYRLLGEEGNGWRQVVDQLSFERGGPERVLSTYPAFAAILAAASAEHGRGLEYDVGNLVARLATLRQLCWQVAVGMDTGVAQIQEAAVLKYVGNRFENRVVEVMRRLPMLPGSDLWRAFADAQLAAPGFGVRGGAADVLLSMIARYEARPEANT
jgi:alkylation response protein AidB-like acyl-CoA dehydrogenase